MVKLPIRTAFDRSPFGATNMASTQVPVRALGPSLRTVQVISTASPSFALSGAVTVSTTRSERGAPPYR